MPLSDLHTFRAKVMDQGGPAKPSRFHITIWPTNPFLLSYRGLLEDMQFLCENAELPGKSLNTTDIRYYGPQFKHPTQLVFNDITLTFVCRDYMQEKSFFDDWMFFASGEPSYDLRFPDEYQGTISAYQYDDLGNTSLEFHMYEAFPVNINPLPTNWAEEGLHRLQVQMAYTYYQKVESGV